MINNSIINMVTINQLLQRCWWIVYNLLWWSEPLMQTHTGTECRPGPSWEETETISTHVGARLTDIRKQEKRTGEVLLAPCCWTETRVPQQTNTHPLHLYVPPRYASIHPRFFPLTDRCSFPHSQIGNNRRDVCLRRSHHQRVGTCTKREYPRSLLPRALRKSRLYTLFII